MWSSYDAGAAEAGGRQRRFVLIWTSVGGLAVRGLEVVIKLALYLLIAKVMGPRESGFLFMALAWSALAATAARLGVERALTRHIAAELSYGQGRRARSLLLHGTAMTFVASVILALLTILGAPLANGLLFHDPGAIRALQVSGLVIPGMTVAFTLTFAIVGLGRPVIAQVLQNLLWPLGLLLGLAAGLRDAVGLTVVLALTFVVIASVAIIVFFADRRRLQVNAPLPNGTALLPSLWTTARPLLIVELVQVSLGTLPVLILGSFASAAEVSVFSVATRISMLVWVVLISLGTVVGPQFAALHRRQDWPALRHLNRTVQLAGAILGGGGSLLMVAAAKPALAILGANFASGAETLVILALGQTINAVYAAQDVLLAMIGQGAVLRMLNILQLATMLGLAFLLIPTFHLTGAAIALGVATAQGGIGTALAARVLVPQAAPRMTPLPFPYVSRLLASFAR